MRAIARAAAVAAATTALAAAPLTAAADDPRTAPPPDCDPGSICGYTGYGYTGETVPLPAGAGCVDLKAPLRSITNTFGSPGIPAVANVYSDRGCAGEIVASVGQEESDPMIVPDGVSVFLAW
ncbi:hypothetical protein LP52_18320 [Streptomonospora alba]|uniref:Peptidase inhibitor family I36 n=1 Tax=Streptomonospora alba TaxID=183763 RepID=A0A0C2FEH1_9ACTN|nr:peptidase inhibitor family I36 protein [Streptomonospora alba]KIH97579.1 hypothetical protein LP52_18320 [Streptomonospora alba]